MNWQDIAAMQKDGMDIESHTMTHAHLNTLNQSQLNFEIGGSKQCLASHDIIQQSLHIRIMKDQITRSW
jgi:peptidoglycan/xylan/chitin deacetylase (PgdA/CDA1 family)